MNNTQQRVEEEQQIIIINRTTTSPTSATSTTTTTTTTTKAQTPYIHQIANQTITYFLDCFVNPSEINNNPHQQQHSSSQTTTTTTYEWIKYKLRSRKRRNIQLKGELTRIAGKDERGFDNSSMQNAMFHYPFYLKYKPSGNKLYISDQGNHIIRSIRNISMNNNNNDDAKWNGNDEWNGKLEIEVGQSKQIGYSNGVNRNTCKLRYPSGTDWDMNDNMYICNSSCICKVDGKSNQVSLVAGHASDEGYKDEENNHEARFNGLKGISCYQQNHHQSPIVLYVSDRNNHCIRMIDVTNGKTITFAGKGEENGDVDGTLQSARFYCPWNIVKDDDENDHILYISDYGNQKVKMIDMKKGMVSTLVGDKNDTSILYYPNQMQIIDSFIYVACYEFRDCIVKINKHSKQVTKIKFNDGKQVSSEIWGITYHELDQCFYISDLYNIYKLE